MGVKRFEVKGKLAGLNEYTAACRSNAYKGAKLKKAEEERIRAAIREYHVSPVTGPVHLVFDWFDAPNRCHRHRDKDNIAFAKKFILDALVAEGVLPDDSWNWVVSFSDHFHEWDIDIVAVNILEGCDE